MFASPQFLRVNICMTVAEKKIVTTALEVIGPLSVLDKTSSTLKDKFLIATLEIVAEMGPDGLSASELIKKTESSKGALFHHFKTLEDLCYASLVYFVNFISQSYQLKATGNTKDCLVNFAESTKKSQFHMEYFNLAHFFRDRAMRDARYRILLCEAKDFQVNKLCEVLRPFLSPQAKIEDIKSIAVFFVINLESVFYHSIFLGRPEMLHEQVQILVQTTENLLLNSAIANSEK
jgi:AcrR family transcriptional regulator